LFFDIVCFLLAAIVIAAIIGIVSFLGSLLTLSLFHIGRDGFFMVSLYITGMAMATGTPVFISTIFIERIYNFTEGWACGGLVGGAIACVVSTIWNSIYMQGPITVVVFVTLFTHAVGLLWGLWGRISYK